MKEPVREALQRERRVLPVRHIGIVLYEGFSLFAAGTLVEAFRIANELQADGTGHLLTYSVILVSAYGGSVSCSSAMTVSTDRLVAKHFERLDTLIVPGGLGIPKISADTNFIDLLRRATANRVKVTATGNADLVLRKMSVESEPRPLIELASAPEHDRHHALNMSLALLRRDLGAKLAARVAGLLGAGSESVISENMDDDSASLAEEAREAARWLEQNCTRPISIRDAIVRSSMSERNFQRLFKRVIGVTPSAYLLRARLDLTCKMLASSDLPVDKIARRSGFSNGERLSKLFRKAFSMSPTEFRARNRPDD
jgi:transcriptional regulator GlxA family with amidase domain